MTAPIPAATPSRFPTPRPGPAPTGGAWLGFGIAVRAGTAVLLSAVSVSFVSLIPVMVDWMDRAIARQARAGDVPPQFDRMLDLWTEMAAILRSSTLALGVSGICIGIALFAAAFGLVVGSDVARKAVRALLVVDALHTLGTAVWLTQIWATRLDAWNARYMATIKELMDSVPNGSRIPMPIDLKGAGWMNAVSYGMMGLVSLGIAGVLFWLAGRPFAREWCAARSGRSGPSGGAGRYPIASTGASG